jgi:hypothetical protein
MIYIWSVSISEFPVIWILIFVVVGISSHLNTDLSNCRNCRMIHFYFHLYISLQPSRIFLTRFRRRGALAGSQNWMPVFLLALHYIWCTYVQLLRWDLSAVILPSSLRCSIVTEPQLCSSKFYVSMVNMFFPHFHYPFCCISLLSSVEGCNIYIAIYGFTTAPKKQRPEC